MSDIIWTVTAFLFAIAILIAVHEFGHFWVARKLKVKVLRFSIGFGRPLLRWRDRLDTEYVISMLPVGGYVKMLNDNEGPVPVEEQHLEFNHKPILSRLAIVSAGPIFNLLFAIIAYWMMYMIGVTEVLPVIGHVKQGSIAGDASLVPGEEILAIENVPIKTWKDVRFELLAHIGESGLLEITTRNTATKLVKHHYLELTNWEIDSRDPHPDLALGISPYRPTLSTEIAGTAENGPAEKAGLKAGDRVLAINGAPVKSWEEMVQVIQNHPNQELTLHILRGNSKRSIKVHSSSSPSSQDNSTGYIGIFSKKIAWPAEYLQQYRYTPWGAVLPAIVDVVDMSAMTFKVIGKMITGDISVRSLSGPIGIARGAGESAKYGIAYYLGFLGVISISLAILNILPIPLLDGGYLLLFIIEGVTGKQASQKTQLILIRIGIIFLASLTLIAFFNDFSRF